LGRVFGIRIGVDISWFFVLFLLIWTLSDSYQDAFPGDDTKAFTLAVVSALLFFLSILLSWATRSSRSATAFRSWASTCGCSAAWPSWAATRTRRAWSSGSRSPDRW
jgi:hypothetical protein